MADKFSWSISKWNRLLKEIIIQFVDGEDPVWNCISSDWATLHTIRFIGESHHSEGTIGSIKVIFLIVALNLGGNRLCIIM